MKLQIGLASSAHQKDAAYRLRYKVFVEEEKYDLGAAHLNGRRFVDFWDTFETTYSFVISSEGRVVATLRCVAESTVGLPDESFFSDHRRALAPGTACFMGRLAVEPAFRTYGLGMLLQEVACSYLRALGIRYVFGLANLRYEQWWESLGYVWIGERLKVPGVAFDLRAHYLDLQGPTPRFSAVDWARGAAILKGETTWTLLDEGDLLYASGDPTNAVWEILEGALTVSSPAGGEVKLGQGELAGALDALAAMPRRQTARASHGRVVAVEMMAEPFVQRVQSDARLSHAVLRDVANQFQRAGGGRS